MSQYRPLLLKGHMFVSLSSCTFRHFDRESKTHKKMSHDNSLLLRHELTYMIKRVCDVTLQRGLWARCVRGVPRCVVCYECVDSRELSFKIDCDDNCDASLAIMTVWKF